jgi:hypothetical protein
MVLEETTMGYMSIIDDDNLISYNLIEMSSGSLFGNKASLGGGLFGNPAGSGAQPSQPLF